jgi:hypothetical protein
MCPASRRHCAFVVRTEGGEDSPLSIQHIQSAGGGQEPSSQHSFCRTTGQRLEKLCSHFLLRPKTLQSERADKRDCGESAGGCKHRAEINCIKQTHNERQGFCPWSPPRGGAWDQSSWDQSSLGAGACRPREKRAPPITSPAPALTLTTPCPVIGALLSALLPMSVLQHLPR